MRAEGATGPVGPSGGSGPRESLALLIARLKGLRVSGGLRRWAPVAVLVVLAAVGAGLWGLSTESGAMVSLFDGAKLTDGEANRAAGALAARGIRVEIGHRGTLRVPAGQVVEARSALRKEDIGPKSPGEIGDEALDKIRPWDTPDQRQALLDRNREKRIQAMIGDLEEIESTDVTLGTANSAGGLRLGATPRPVKVMVRYRTERDRPLSPGAVDHIASIVAIIVPEAKPEDLTLLDSAGRHEPIRPGLTRPDTAHHELSRARAKEDEWVERIAAKLNWIEGVRVSVRFDLAEPPVAPPLPPPAASPPRIGMNVPLSAPDGVSKPADIEPVPLPAPPSAKAKVLVLVPASQYARAVRPTERADRQPTASELGVYVRRVEDSIRTTVAYTVPAEELGEVQVQTIPDIGAGSGSTESPVLIPVATWSDWLRGRSWGPWTAVLVTAAAAGGIPILVMRARAAARRRTARQRRLADSENAARTRGRRGETLASATPGGATPLERVRDLVRLEPEAAAGVLQRWVGHGGHHA